MQMIPIHDQKKMAIRAAVLRTLYIGGTLSLMMLAPRTTRLIGSLDRGKTHRNDLYRRIRNAKNLLKHQGLVREDERGMLKLTEHGQRRIERVLLKEYVIPPQVLWDGKWRVLMFDIRERRRRVRSRLRQLLQSAGFVRLQDSVWVHPYPCDEFVQLIRAHLASGVGELRSIVAEALESDGRLREHFHLL